MSLSDAKSDLSDADNWRPAQTIVSCLNDSRSRDKVDREAPTGAD